MRIEKKGESMGLLEEWGKWDPGSGPPYILDVDREILDSARWQNKRITLTLEQAAIDPAYSRGLDDRSLHLGLFPLPFIGDLRNASIYVLMANPGLDGTYDYSGVTDGVADWLRGQLSQEFGDALPFGTSFDPKNVAKGGGDYFRDKLMSTVEHIAENSGRPRDDVLLDFATKFAVIQLVPYHSRRFVNGAHKLPSADLAVEFVQETVVPRVREGEAILIVTRKVNEWRRNQGLPQDLIDDGRIVLYTELGEANRAHLNPNSRGGKAILKQFGIEA